MEANKKSFWRSMGIGALTDGIVIGGIEMLKGAFKENGPILLKALFPFLSTNDEALFQSACSYAKEKYNVTTRQINKIGKVMLKYPEARARIVAIIGKDEQVVKLQNGEEEPRNARGAATIFLMSDMTEKQILIFLKASGSFDTMGHNLEMGYEKIAIIVKNLANSHEVKDGVAKVIATYNNTNDSLNDWLDEPTVFEKIGDKLDIFNLKKRMNIQKRI